MEAISLVTRDSRIVPTFRETGNYGFRDCLTERHLSGIMERDSKKDVLQQKEIVMSEIAAPCTYFAQPGPRNTARTLELARARAQALGIQKALVATTSGAAGVQAARQLREFDVIVVSHSAGFSAPNTVELSADNRSAIEAAGAKILTCQHAFGGVGRAVRKKLGTFQIDEIMAFTLRTFGQGIKVVAEMALMAADAGLVRTDEAILAIAGSGHGADTATILRPTNAQTFFDLRFLEIICMPAPGHPAQ